jgi:hypothetical protein
MLSIIFFFVAINSLLRYFDAFQYFFIGSQNIFSSLRAKLKMFVQFITVQCFASPPHYSIFDSQFLACRSYTPQNLIPSLVQQSDIAGISIRFCDDSDKVNSCITV